MSALKKEKKKYTYSDYCKWDDGKRWELIEGIPYAMSPAPARKHQRILGKLYLLFGNFLKNKQCEIYPAPFDVRLNGKDEDDTVVQPDISVICDRSKLNDKGCVGAPDLIIEILSPSTARKDRIKKFNQYQKAGVAEYWIVDPDTESVQVHLLNEQGQYVTFAYENDADFETLVPVNILEGLVINLQEVFSQMP